MAHLYEGEGPNRHARRAAAAHAKHHPQFERERKARRQLEAESDLRRAGIAKRLAAAQERAAERRRQAALDKAAEVREHMAGLKK